MCTQFGGLGLPFDSFRLAWPILDLLLLSALPGVLRGICNAQQLLLWAPAVCWEMALSPGVSPVFKMYFISDRHLCIFALEKAGQRTEACV